MQYLKLWFLPAFILVVFFVGFALFNNGLQTPYCNDAVPFPDSCNKKRRDELTPLKRFLRKDFLDSQQGHYNLCQDNNGC
jgi:hypothetical protein